MKVVVIGNGIVGNALVEAVCKEGHNVTVIDDNSDEITAAVFKYRKNRRRQ